MGLIRKGITAANRNTAATASQTNSTILRGQGVDLATVLTPAGRRKKRAGLIGQDPEEKIITVLGG